MSKQTLNTQERAILREIADEASQQLVMRTRTRLDAGSWWRRAPLCLCVTRDSIVVFAASRRYYIQEFPLMDCQTSHYCHSTGELVIEAGEELKFNRLAMSPTDGLKVLEIMTSIQQTSHQPR